MVLRWMTCHSPGEIRPGAAREKPHSSVAREDFSAFDSRSSERNRQHREEKISGPTQGEMRVKHHEAQQDHQIAKAGRGSAPDSILPQPCDAPQVPARDPREECEGGEEGQTADPEEPHIATLDIDPLAPMFWRGDARRRTYAPQPVEPRKEFGEKEAVEVAPPPHPAARKARGRLIEVG